MTCIHSFVENDYKYKISLKLALTQYQKTLLEYSSNSYNGTWNLKDFFEMLYINIPSYEEHMEIVKTCEKLERSEKL